MRQDLKLKSGIFKVRPKTLLTLNSGGMIRLTPKKTYHAFRTDYEIKNQPGKETIMIVKDDVRWFPVVEGYASNNFDFVEDDKVGSQDHWISFFNNYGEHIKKNMPNIRIGY